VTKAPVVEVWLMINLVDSLVVKPSRLYMAQEVYGNLEPEEILSNISCRHTKIAWQPQMVDRRNPPGIQPSFTESPLTRWKSLVAVSSSPSQRDGWDLRPRIVRGQYYLCISWLRCAIRTQSEDSRTREEFEFFFYRAGVTRVCHYSRNGAETMGGYTYSTVISLRAIDISYGSVRMK